MSPPDSGGRSAASPGGGLICGGVLGVEAFFTGFHCFLGTDGIFGLGKLGGLGNG